MAEVTKALLSSSISIKKILVPVDGSNASVKALQYATHLAELEASNTELIVVHVLEDVKQGGAIGLQAKYGNVRLVEGFKRARRQARLGVARASSSSCEGKGDTIKD